MYKILKCVGIFSLLLFVAEPAQAVVEYSITPLGDFQPKGINSYGDVVGLRSFPGDIDHAVLYSNGAMKDLGTLGGDSSRAYGINDSGQVVGESQVSDGTYHAFLYQNGSMTDLGLFLGQKVGLQMGAGAINNKGQIAGVWCDAIGSTYVFLYDNKSIVNYEWPC